MNNISVAAVDHAISNRPMSGFQIRILLVCAVLLVFDGYDVGAIGYAVPALAEAWGLRPAAFTPAIVLSGVGMLLGSLIAGPLGDWYGRKPVLIGCVTLFGVFSLASALCNDVSTLAITRVLTGLGLGGGIPAAIALTSDFAPARNRPMIVGAMTAGVPIGLVIGGVSASKLIPIYGWQAIFIVGGAIPLLFLPILIWRVSESVQMSLTLGKARQTALDLLKRMAIDPDTLPSATASTVAVRNPVKRLFQDGHAVRTILLWGMFLSNFLATWLVIFWLPTILTASGAAVGDAAFYSALLPAGALIGIGLIGYLASKHQIETVLAAALLIGTAAIFVLWHADLSLAATAFVLIITGIGNMGGQFGMNGLSGSVYPTEIRATGSGWAFGVGRIGNIVGPALGGMVLSLGFAPKAMFLMAAFACSFAALGVLLLARERTLGRLDIAPTRSPDAAPHEAAASS